MSAAGGAIHHAARPDRPGKQRRVGWLWLLVAFQVAIPASYYLRADRDDERFAWRMFSAVRVQSCRVRVLEIGSDGTTRSAVDLDASLHSGWVTLLERGRTRVIERFLAQRCQLSRASRAELRRSCEDAADRELGTERFSLDCAAQRMTRERVR